MLSEKQKHIWQEPAFIQVSFTEYGVVNYIGVCNVTVIFRQDGNFCTLKPVSSCSKYKRTLGIIETLQVVPEEAQPAGRATGCTYWLTMAAELEQPDVIHKCQTVTEGLLDYMENTNKLFITLSGSSMMISHTQLHAKDRQLIFCSFFPSVASVLIDQGETTEDA